MSADDRQVTAGKIGGGGWSGDVARSRQDIEAAIAGYQRETGVKHPLANRAVGYQPDDEDRAAIKAYEAVALTWAREREAAREATPPPGPGALHSAGSFAPRPVSLAEYEARERARRQAEAQAREERQSRIRRQHNGLPASHSDR